MPNSAITQQVQGLATTTSPGLVGTGAQTLAGKKTFDGGALIKGDTSGNLIPTGYVGELYTSSWSSQTIVTGAGTTLTSLSNVQPGTYLCIIETDVSFGSATRVVPVFGGTATRFYTKNSAGDFVRDLDPTAACLYATYHVRVTVAGSLTFGATSATGNTNADCRGSFSLLRIA